MTGLYSRAFSGGGGALVAGVEVYWAVKRTRFRVGVHEE